jgi:hypothetical protein
MARKKDDLILRDRLQFDIDSNGDLDVVYGRVDMSDFVSTVGKKGMSIKEVRFMVRDPSTAKTGTFNQRLNNIVSANASSYLKLFATTTAYESAVDVGLGSPNVFAIVEHQQYTTVFEEPVGPVVAGGNSEIVYFQYGTPDLHPDGYTVVTDILIGVAAENCTVHSDKTLEVDIMIIAEPVNVTQKELNEMLIQAQDL